MFRRKDDIDDQPADTAAPRERITTVLGDGTSYKGKLTGSGGARIEGGFEGEILLDGLLVIGPTGRVTCEDLRAKTVIVAGIVRGDITAHKVEIRASGRVWGNVTTLAFATEEGAFLRGQIQMEEELDLKLSGTEAKEAPPEEDTLRIEEQEETEDTSK
jgi:cytoskeletal protein CcmA (bactofilin family)